MLLEFKRAYRSALVYKSKDNWLSTNEKRESWNADEFLFLSCCFHSSVTLLETRIYRILITSCWGWRGRATWRKPTTRPLWISAVEQRLSKTRKPSDHDHWFPGIEQKLFRVQRHFVLLSNRYRWTIYVSGLENKCINIVSFHSSGFISPENRCQYFPTW
jgi:hypothetical protein